MFGGGRRPDLYEALLHIHERYRDIYGYRVGPTMFNMKALLGDYSTSLCHVGFAQNEESDQRRRMETHATWVVLQSCSR